MSTDKTDQSVTSTVARLWALLTDEVLKGSIEAGVIARRSAIESSEGWLDGEGLSDNTHEKVAYEAMRSYLLAALTAEATACVWRPIENQIGWRSACNKQAFRTGYRLDFQFCPYCGHPLSVEPREA